MLIFLENLHTNLSAYVTSNSTPVYETKTVVTLTSECIGKPTGFYSLGCQSNFFYCVDGVTAELKCPEELFYDILTNTCDYRYLIEACGGKREKSKFDFF